MTANIMCYFALCNHLLLICISYYKSVFNTFYPQSYLEIVCGYVSVPHKVKLKGVLLDSEFLKYLEMDCVFSMK